ncbi:MAG: DNA helicase RecQ [Anaerolineales bacterium]|jgi:ATP-dependent DNA helicase RecQ|nr:DNA helicase RecQ [Anaerolineales bacterium]
MIPETILKNTFGYDTFRPLQREIIENVLNRRDSLAIMPTGGGKSLCYQIPALIFEGLTVVVSPLIALMKDQVEQMRAAGVPALFLNSSLSPQAYSENMEYVRRGQVKLLYVAPETLLTARILGLLSELKLDCLTIDEAHCISEWGHDFRPEYRQLADVRRRYPQAVCLALTATATPRVRADITRSLGFKASNEFVASFNRENLFIEVVPKQDAEIQLTRFLERFKDQSGIIYCFSRRQVDELSEYLQRRGYAVRPYHAGLDDEARRRNQEAYIRDDVQIMVATIAFGMGINKPNVRFVVHYDLPKSIEGYYQEIGRAGRDGLPAHCLLLYNYGDAAKLKYFIDQKEGDERRAAVQQLDAIVRYAEDERSCRRKPLLAYFGEKFPAEKCDNCDNCNAEAPILDEITIPAQKFLSCVARTGERFGAGHVADVLLGSKNEKILRLKHDTLSTHGIGRELTQKQWMHLARQLAQMGYLNQNGEYRTLSLTEKARAVLKSRAKIFGQLQEAAERAKKKDNLKELEYNHALFALLRAKRKELADADGVPPYVIFSDRTLVEMAAYYPQSRQALLAISGVGQVKLEKFGELFLKVLLPYCKKHKIAEKAREPAPPKREKPARDAESGLGMRTTLIGGAYNDGEAVEALMKRYQVTVATIIDHLTRYALAGNRLRNGEEFQALTSSSPDDQQLAFAVFDELGAGYLKPVFDKLEGRLNYDELKILRLCFLAR